MNLLKIQALRPSPAYATASYAALAIGTVGFCVGLWNAEMMLSEKGYYFITLLFGLFAAVSIQRVARDKSEGFPVSASYHGVCYAALAISIAAIVIGLWNANLLLSEKGFYAVCFIMGIFSAITVQKNVRDIQTLDEVMRPEPARSYVESKTEQD